MARDVGFLSPDFTIPCNERTDGIENGDPVCRVRLLGLWLDTASFRLDPPLLVERRAETR